jgi:hypothetical protein
MTTFLGFLGISLIVSIYYFLILPISIYLIDMITEGESELKLPHNHEYCMIKIITGTTIPIICYILIYFFIIICEHFGKFIQKSVVFI